MFGRCTKNKKLLSGLDLASDHKDWENLSNNERHFVSHILAFFAVSDGIVNKNLAENFATKVTIAEARCF